ncbi:MAG: lytic transglycosylase domain-containing protein [Actinomycetia bacterium]|nr:lytic transglycosylase domain-containing protein [Actinomycetes bacterium]
MLVAYHQAASIMAEEQSRCQITWTLLAGVGRSESNHARYGGARTDLAGDLSPRIIGPRLDGVEFQEIFDTDGGRLDGDVEYDRAVGPMQFIPGTWRSFGRDGDGDGDADPQNVFDATLAAADYLCRSGPLVGTDRLRVALLSYNQSDAYGQAVLDSWARYEALGLNPEEPWLGGPVPEKLAYLPQGAADGLDGVSP